jgi:hypothetical protein
VGSISIFIFYFFNIFFLMNFFYSGRGRGVTLFIGWPRMEEKRKGGGGVYKFLQNRRFCVKKSKVAAALFLVVDNFKALFQVILSLVRFATFDRRKLGNAGCN